MSQEEEKASAQFASSLSIDAIEEILEICTPWKDELASKIKRGRIPKDHVPQALINWFTKVMQMIRNCMTEGEFEKVLAISHPEVELPQTYQQASLSSANRSLFSLHERISSLSENLLGPESNIFKSLNKAREDILN